MTAVVLVLLTLCVCFGIRSYAKKLRQGGGCCGEREPAEKKVRVADRNRSHYPYHAVLKIDGMVCANCARRVENAINRMDGYWAEADVAGARANVHCKEKPDLGQLEEAVRAAIRCCLRNAPKTRVTPASMCCTQKIFGVFCLTFSRACAIYKRYKEKGADGDSKHRAKAKANRGEWKPGASSTLPNIPPELQAEPLVSHAGFSPLSKARMLVRCNRWFAKQCLRPVRRTEAFFCI